MKRLFVTSTGTGIGKTFVSALLVREARARDLPMTALKPVISGFEMSAIAESDTGILMDALGIAPTEAALEAISPWRFAAPLAPNMAAKREDRTLDIEALIAFCREAEGERVLVEGVGGVMVPLDDRRTVLDWAAALGWPALLVAGAYLGTISHTLTALQALRGARIPIAAILVTEAETGPVAIDETCSTIRAFAGGDVPVLALPKLSGNTPSPPLLDAVGLGPIAESA